MTFLQDRLQAKGEEIAELKAEIRRLQRSRLLSVEGLPSDRDTVTLPAAELSALKKDLEVLIHYIPSIVSTLFVQCFLASE